MGEPRHPGRAGGFYPALVGADRDLLGAVAGVDSTLVPEVPGLAVPLRQGQRAQLPGASGSLDGGLGEAGDRGVPRQVFLGGIPSALLHDARPGHRGGQPGQRLPGAQGRRVAGGPVEQAPAQGHGVRPATGAARALAHRFFLRERGGNLLLPVQHPGRVLALDRALGDPGIDEGIGCGAGAAKGPGEASPGEAEDHLRQRAAIRGQGLQRVPEAVANQSRTDEPVLPRKQWKARTIPSNPQGAGHPAQDAADGGGCTAGGGGVRGALQHGAVAQRPGLCHAAGSAGAPAPGNLRRERPEARGGKGASTSVSRQAIGVRMKKRGLAMDGAAVGSRTSTRRIGLCWEATRAPEWTRRPRARAASAARVGSKRERQQSGKSQGVWGTESPESFPDQTKTKTGGKSALAFSSNRRFTLNQYSDRFQSLATDAIAFQFPEVAFVP